MKAIDLGRVNENEALGNQRLYRLDPPLSGYSDATGPFEYVVVSAVVAYSGPETYIFGADKEGKIVDWAELPGSFRGAMDHVEALEGAGYEV